MSSISEGCRFRSFMTVQEEKHGDARVPELRTQRDNNGHAGNPKRKKKSSKKRTHPGIGHRAPPGAPEEVQGTGSDSKCMVGTP